MKCTSKHKSARFDLTNKNRSPPVAGKRIFSESPARFSSKDLNSCGGFGSQRIQIGAETAIKEATEQGCMYRSKSWMQCILVLFPFKFPLFRFRSLGFAFVLRSSFLRGGGSVPLADFELPLRPP